MLPAPLVRNDLLKSLHMTLLQMLPSETRSFWKSHPLILEGRKLGETGLLRHIWEDGAQSPLDYQNRVLESLEPFLLERGVPVEQFVDRLSYWGNRNSFLNARFMLRALNPLLSLFLKSSDAMSFILVFADMVGSRLVKGLNFPILKREENGDKKIVHTMLKVAELYRGGLTPWDGHLYSGKLLRVGPKAMGLPPYDSVESLSDARPIEKVVWNGGFKRADGAFHLLGQRVGTERDFHGFCAEQGLDVDPYDLPPMRGIVMDVDYRCPSRGRIVLRKGCFYGAPVYLFKVTYSKHYPRPDHYLFHFIEEATLDEPPAWAELGQAHLDLVEAARETLRVEYRHSEESLYVESAEFIRGVPAKIFCRVLREYQSSGRTLFTFREFKYDREIYYSHKNTGFEVSLGRLGRALEKAGYSLEIRPQGNGKFELSADCRVVFKESRQGPGQESG